MKKILVRHAKSQANYPYEIGVNNKTAALTPNGKEQAKGLASSLSQFGISSERRIATSTFMRAKQTAWLAGFWNATAYPILDEAIDRPLTEQERDLIHERGILPADALTAAEALLHEPPIEEVWITHALVIAGICQRLNIQADAIIPRFCEVRAIEI